MKECYFAKAFNFATKSNNLPWVFFTFFKLYKWYKIAQKVSHVPSVELPSLNNYCLRFSLQNQIENSNVTDVVDFEALEAKFFTPLGYALSLVIKLAPLAFYLGAPFVVQQISKRFSSKQVSD